MVEQFEGGDGIGLVGFRKGCHDGEYNVNACRDSEVGKVSGKMAQGVKVGETDPEGDGVWYE